jgi:hypothetical protein
LAPIGRLAQLNRWHRFQWPVVEKGLGFSVDNRKQAADVIWTRRTGAVLEPEDSKEFTTLA